ncbi:MAG: XdhC family protein [Fidelibacterota bacterium]
MIRRVTSYSSSTKSAMNRLSRDNDIFQEIVRLREVNEDFSIATVIAVKGSSSGRVGDRAIFSEDGKRLMGWIGAGCVENRVGKTATETLVEGKPRIVTIDLNGDTMRSGIPCGGRMSILVEPQLKTPVILIRGMGRVAETLSELGNLLDFRVVVQVPEEEESRYSGCHKIMTGPLELDEVDFQIDYLVLLTHHRDDDSVSLQALEMGIRFVAVMASEKKTNLIIEYLKAHGVSPEDLNRLHAPAGLDLNAKSAEEIALSIMAEIVLHRNGGTGSPLNRMVREDTVR